MEKEGVETKLNSSIKFLLWGFGGSNKVILKQLVEKGFQVVGVIGRHDIGECPFKVAGLSKDLAEKNNHSNLKIVHPDKSDEFLKTQKVDICILSTKTTLDEVYAELKTLGEHSINVFTLAEELFYSWETSPDKTKELNDLYCKNNVFLIGGGLQDMHWGHIPLALLGSSHKVEKITGVFRYNLNDYSAAIAGYHCLNLTPEEFDEAVKKQNDRSYNYYLNHWIAAAMKWKIKDQVLRKAPIILDIDVTSTSFGEIKPGKSTGKQMIVTSTCENGIIIETNMQGRVYYGDMQDNFTWTIEGEPKTVLEVKNPNIYELTGASIVNRINQVIKTKKVGYILTYELGLSPYEN